MRSTTRQPAFGHFGTERTSNRVYIRADGAIPYARVVTVMGALNAAGITNIGLVTEDG